jgi:hypothetical protein
VPSALLNAQHQGYANTNATVTIHHPPISGVRAGDSRAAEGTGRYVTINSTASLATVSTYPKQRAPTRDPGSISIPVTPGVTGGLRFVTVTATRQFAFAADLVGLSPIEPTGQSRVPANP